MWSWITQRLENPAILQSHLDALALRCVGLGSIPWARAGRAEERANEHEADRRALGGFPGHDGGHSAKRLRSIAAFETPGGLF